MFLASHISLPGTRSATAPRASHSMYFVATPNSETPGAPPLQARIQSCWWLMPRCSICGGSLYSAHLEAGSSQTPSPRAVGGHVALGADEHRSVAGSRSAVEPPPAAAAAGAARTRRRRASPAAPAQRRPRPPSGVRPAPQRGRRFPSTVNWSSNQHHAVAAAENGRPFSARLFIGGKSRSFSAMPSGFLKSPRMFWYAWMVTGGMLPRAGNS